MERHDSGRLGDGSPLGEIFGQLRQINDRLARIETVQSLKNDEHERRIAELEETPGKRLAAAGTISLVCSGVLTGLIWLFNKVSK